MPDSGDMGWLERARRDREQRQRQLEGMFGDARQSREDRQEKLKGLFGNREPEPDEGAPLHDYVTRARDEKEARQKSEAQLFEAERAAREREQKEMVKRLFNREPPTK